jgi:uncharacterized protein (UPF0248 family)
MKSTFKYFYFLLFIYSCSDNQQIKTETLANISKYDTASKLLSMELNKFLSWNKEEKQGPYDHTDSEKDIIFSSGEFYFKNTILKESGIKGLKPVLDLWHEGLLAGGYRDLTINTKGVIIYHIKRESRIDNFIIYKENLSSEDIRQYRFDDIEVIDKNTWYASNRIPIFRIYQ